MPAMPLTDDRWAGLPLLCCDMDPGLYRIDVLTPMLVIRDDLGTNVEVLEPDGAHVEFRQAPLRFDLFASGLHMNAVSDRVATKSLVVALPAQWLPFDPAGTDRRLDLGSRFQFTDAGLRRLVMRLTAHHRGGEPLGHGYSRAVSRSIVDRVVRLQLAQDAMDPEGAGLHPEARRVVAAFVDAHLQEHISVAAMAARAGIGVARFVQQFKRTFATTPHQYVHQRRLLRAREMLLGTDAPLTTIAIDTGFASHSHFSTAFRAATGMAPSRYRQLAGLAEAEGALPS